MKLCRFQNLQNHKERFDWRTTWVIQKWRIWGFIYLKICSPIIKIFWKKTFSMNESYYSLARFCRKIFFNSFFYRKWPKTMILGFFFSQSPDKIYHKFLVFYDGKIFCQILGIRNIFKYREKIALRNIEYAMEITY